MLIIQILITGLLWPSLSSSQVATSITTGAYTLLNERAGEARKNFFVYKDAESGFNHAFPSGVFGTPGKIELDSACIESLSGCSTDTNQIDRNHGTVMRISFAPLSGGQFAGIQFEEPENYGARPRGLGYDVRGATNIVFDVRCLTPGGIRVQFIVGGSTTNFMTISQSATLSTLSLPLSSFNPPVNLADLHILFGVVANDINAPNGGTLLLDNVRFDPVPASQQRVLGLPLGTETFGIVPVQSPSAGRVPIPPDQINRNAAAVYESALTLWALLDRGSLEDLANARIIAPTRSTMLFGTTIPELACLLLQTAQSLCTMRIQPETSLCSMTKRRPLRGGLATSALPASTLRMPVAEPQGSAL